MRTPFRIIVYRWIAVFAAVLLFACIYHVRVCPLRQPTPIVLFPTINLQSNVTFSAGVPVVGDKVLVLKKNIGVIVETNRFNCKVLYLSAEKGVPLTSVFPYTVLQKINVDDLQ